MEFVQEQVDAVKVLWSNKRQVRARGAFTLLCLPLCAAALCIGSVCLRTLRECVLRSCNCAVSGLCRHLTRCCCVLACGFRHAAHLPAQFALQGLNLAMIIFSALMIWKTLMVVTHSESPVVVVLRYGRWRRPLVCSSASRERLQREHEARVPAWGHFVSG